MTQTEEYRAARGCLLLALPVIIPLTLILLILFVNRPPDPQQEMLSWVQTVAIARMIADIATDNQPLVQGLPTHPQALPEWFMVMSAVGAAAAVGTLLVLVLQMRKGKS